MAYSKPRRALGCISYNPLGWSKDLSLMSVVLVWLFPSLGTWTNPTPRFVGWMKTSPRTLLTQSRVSSSFIHPFEDDTTTHLALNSSFSTLVSLLAPGKTIKGFNFVPSAFAVKQTEPLSSHDQLFSWLSCCGRLNQQLYLKACLAKRLFRPLLLCHCHCRRTLRVAVLLVTHMRSVCRLVFRDPFGILLSCAIYITHVWSWTSVSTQCLPWMLEEVPFPCISPRGETSLCFWSFSLIHENH